MCDGSISPYSGSSRMARNWVVAWGALLSFLNKYSICEINRLHGEINCAELSRLKALCKNRRHAKPS